MKPSRRTLTPDAALLRRTSIRLGLQTFALVLACLLVVAAAVFAVVSHGQNESDRRSLVGALAALDDPGDAPAGMWVAISGEHGLSTSRGAPSGFPDVDVMASVAEDGATRWTTVSTASGEAKSITGVSKHGIMQASLDPHENHEERDRLMWALGIAGAIGAVLAGLGGAWFGRRAVRPMADSLALQRRFIADASHELRTPMTLLSTRVQLLGKHLAAESVPVSTRIRTDVDGVRSDAAALAALFDDMLLAADQRTVAVADVNLSSLVREVTSAATAEAVRHGVALVCTLGDDAPEVIVVTGEVAARRALTALVDNAIEHAATQVDITVTVRSGNGRMTVTDDGPGIAADQRSLVFERFASRPVSDVPDSPLATSPSAAVDNRSTTDLNRAPARRRHYGLGLALVAEIAAHYDGKVVAEGRRDGKSGAAISLELPLKR